MGKTGRRLLLHLRSEQTRGPPTVREQLFLAVPDPDGTRCLGCRLNCDSRD